MLHACCRSSSAAGMNGGQSPEESQGMASAWAQLIDASTPRGDRSPHLSCKLLRWKRCPAGVHLQGLIAASGHSLNPSCPRRCGQGRD